MDRRKLTLNNTLADINSKKRVLSDLANAEQEAFHNKFLVLKNNGRSMGCGEAWQWYEAHKEQFKYPVYVPLLSITLVSEEAGKYLENIVAQRDFLMFIFGCAEDESLLTDKRHPWRINSCVVSKEEVTTFCWFS
ncbi:unnamed protein product [Gongylonema pulchrum]|uniref:Uncharacterized protein n=1 Tax=Gongylonema pulchrum TaxID=637853 RepID=A0A3P6QKU5_9BILA|nr:unnamed protein product [Gongylonema pulchrum]